MNKLTPVKFDRASKKVCRQEVIVTSTFFDHGSGHTEYNHDIFRVMCIGHECIHWRWVTDTAGMCCKGEVKDGQE